MMKGFGKKIDQSVVDGSTEEVHYSIKQSASEVACVVIWMCGSVIRLDIGLFVIQRNRTIISPLFVTTFLKLRQFPGAF
jgi:hypothetical protein